VFIPTEHIVAVRKYRQTEFMHKHHSETTTTINASTEVRIDLTSVFRLAGLPHIVSASQMFEAKYQLLAPDGQTDHYDIIWAVRCAIVGCLLNRPLRTRRGKALLVEFPSFQRGACDVDVRIVILITDQRQVCLMLPEEFQEPSAYRLLVAESDEGISQRLDLLLRRAEFNVTITRSGAAALDCLHEENFDLALLDADLPDIDGFALCTRLHADPVLQNLPVVLCSARHGIGGLAAKAGAVGFLEKPLDFVHLPDRLRQFLGSPPPVSAASPK
jgi:CheY-like chemotaxis protein